MSAETLNLYSFLLIVQITVSQCRLINNDYTFVYSCHMPSEATILGSVSLLLTVLNIICIFVAGIAVLKASIIYRVSLTMDYVISSCITQDDINVVARGNHDYRGAVSAQYNPSWKGYNIPERGLPAYI